MKEQEYRRKEREFMERRDALCEKALPELCDCSKCPAKDLCEWLDDNHPDAIGKRGE